MKEEKLMYKIGEEVFTLSRDLDKYQSYRIEITKTKIWRIQVLHNNEVSYWGDHSDAEQVYAECVFKTEGEAKAVLVANANAIKAVNKKKEKEEEKERWENMHNTHEKTTKK